MTAVHEEVKLEKFEFDDIYEGYLYPCPCGDEFYISLDDLKDGKDIAQCSSCSLKVRVLYDHKKFLADLKKQEAAHALEHGNDENMRALVA